MDSTSPFPMTGHAQSGSIPGTGASGAGSTPSHLPSATHGHSLAAGAERERRGRNGDSANTAPPSKRSKQTIAHATSTSTGGGAAGTSGIVSGSTHVSPPAMPDASYPNLHHDGPSAATTDANGLLVEAAVPAEAGTGPGTGVVGVSASTTASASGMTASVPTAAASSGVQMFSETEALLFFCRRSICALLMQKLSFVLQWFAVNGRPSIQLDEPMDLRFDPVAAGSIARKVPVELEPFDELPTLQSVLFQDVARLTALLHQIMPVACKNDQEAMQRLLESLLPRCTFFGANVEPILRRNIETTIRFLSGTNYNSYSSGFETSSSSYSR